MKISKVVRRRGRGGVSAVNAVITTNLGESGQDTRASSRQHVEIVQRSGHTEVREHFTDDDKETGDISQSTSGSASVTEKP